eukprot:365177-Chlamydomonas_euryale.AAC.2
MRTMSHIQRNNCLQAATLGHADQRPSTTLLRAAVLHGVNAKQLRFLSQPVGVEARISLERAPVSHLVSLRHMRGLGHLQRPALCLAARVTAAHTLG